MPDAPEPEGADATRRLLTIVVPCYNERDTILKVLERVQRLPVDKSVIVVDNCSTDGTRELLRSVSEPATPSSHRWGAELRGRLAPDQELLLGDGFAVVLQPRNHRKGASVKLGLSLAESVYFVCQDADLEYDPGDILRLLEQARLTGAAAVFGSRLSRAEGAERQPVKRRLDSFQLGRVALTHLFQWLYQSPITDVATCYKLMKTDVARSLGLRADGFDLDFEIPAKLRVNGYDIIELPISFAPRDQTQGKKIRWRDGVAATWTLLQIRVRSARSVSLSSQRPLSTIPVLLASAAKHLFHEVFT